MPNPDQHEDIWSRAVTINGFRVDEIRSVLQKSIRRGLIEEAVLAAWELFVTGPPVEELLWRRLEIIAVEDVGMGLPEAPMLLAALNEQRVRQTVDIERFMFCAHAVRLLAAAKKDRTTMELAAWAQAVTSRGEKQVEVKDIHVDQHTRRGVRMGRDSSFWWASGGYRLANQLDPAGSPWSQYVRDALGAPPDLDDPGTGAAPDRAGLEKPAPPDLPVDDALREMGER